MLKSSHWTLLPNPRTSISSYCRFSTPSASRHESGMQASSQGLTVRAHEDGDDEETPASAAQPHGATTTSPASAAAGSVSPSCSSSASGADADADAAAWPGPIDLFLEVDGIMDMDWAGILSGCGDDDAADISGVDLFDHYAGDGFDEQVWM